MRIGKFCLGGFLVLVFLGLFAVGIANAQFPDLSRWEGKWFKLSQKTTENVYNGASIVTQKIKVPTLISYALSCNPMTP